MNRSSSSSSQGHQENKLLDMDDDHENDTVMPGFRFHPTEEELVEFYLRRKVEGKRFNVDLITFLDLYRYDPWELPGLAAIGEKEWYFYVPRDRKYRNGDRPNRVTTSGYWKATGADRMIRSENSLRSIGLKKTLVFYTGKAPKGIRTGWIMNEYRLPQHDTQCLQKGEISLCRVYKRPGVEFYPRSLPTTKQRLVGSSSTSRSNAKLSESSPSSSTDIVGTNLALSHPLIPITASSSTISSSDGNEQQMISFFSTTSTQAVDDLHKLVNTCNDPRNNGANLVSNFSSLQAEPPVAPAQAAGLAINVIPAPLQPAFVEKLWDWNAVFEAGKDYYTDLFK